MFKVVKTSSWYDPEGLNIPDNSEKVLFRGEYEDALRYLLNLRIELIEEFSDRHDISVKDIQKRRNDVKVTMNAFGEKLVTYNGYVPKTELFEVCYCSAGANEYYSIVEEKGATK